MRILLLTNLFPIPHDRERGVFTLQLAQRLRRAAEVEVICPLPWFPRWKPFTAVRRYAAIARTPPRYRIEDIEVHAPRYPLIPKLSENRHAALMAIGLRNTMVRLHRQKPFDVVNSQWLYPDSVACDGIARRLGIPHVATGLGCDINRDLQDPGKRAGILRMLHRCEAVTVVSKDLKAGLVDNGIAAGKIDVIPNGIDGSSFRLRDRGRCRERLGLDPAAKILLFVGRLSEEKDPATLVEAIGRLARDDKAPRLYFVGEGPLGSSLAERVRSLGIEDRVRFVGKVAHADVGTWMGACDALCLSSLREGCPNVILEALGSGRPVVASRVGAIPDLVREFSGLLFTPGDTEQLAQLIERAMRSDWSASRIADSMQKLTWEAAADAYLACFRRAMRVEGPRTPLLEH